VTRFVTDPRVISDSTGINLLGLTGFTMTVTPTSFTYSGGGDSVTFTGTGISQYWSDVPITQSVTGYVLTLQGIRAQTVTGLNLGPEEYEQLVATEYWTGSNAATLERFYRGNDVLVGGSYGDYLDGLTGNDTISGRDGNDTLVGGEGNDKIIGGRGTDVLVGGAGSDDFIFKSLKDASHGTDRIKDFEVRIDDIDLRGIDANSSKFGDQKFHYIHASKFSGDEGELRAFQKGTIVYVQGDTDGDGKADFEIRVGGITKLDAGDFIL
jgi:Ca2+-binding RTX toxin-like protein